MKLRAFVFPAVVRVLAVFGAGTSLAADPLCATAPQPLAWRTAAVDARPQADADGLALHGRRVWVEARARNDADTPLRLTLQLAFDPRDDGSVLFSQPGVLFVAPHSSDGTRLTAWVDPRVHRVAVLAPAGSMADAVRITLTLGCAAERSTFAAPSRQQPLLDEALDLYDRNVVRAPADPGALRRLAQGWATGAEVPDDVFWALRVALANVGDHHSYIVPSVGRAAFFDMLAPAPPVVRLRDDGLALVAVSQVGFDGDEPARRDYARRLQAAIAATASRHPGGWILDLRDFGGGDMWVTLAGLSALVDGPLVGEFVTREGRVPWLVAGGRAGTTVNPDIVATGLHGAAMIDAPVAVLVGPGTASAGEMTAIAFMQRPRTRFFGQPTTGFGNTGVQQYTLSDGTMFGIAHTLNADRTGRILEGALVPDTLVADGEDPVSVAAAWLRQWRR